MGASLSSEGRTRLQAAVEEKNHQKVLKVLADAPGLASKPLRYRGRDRPLHIAARRGFTGAVVALVEAAKNNPSDRDPLDMEQRLHKLLDARSEKGETALMLACAYGHPDVVSYLLKSGADPTLPDTGLRTCMHHAVMGQSPECIEELLKHKVTALPRKAVVYHRASTEGGVLLKDLCMMGYRGRPSRFIDLGALLNITPLHLATALGDVASMKVLLDHGATQLPVCRGVLIDPQVGLPLWRANSTALHIAVGNRDLQAVGLLLREYVYGSEVPLLSGFDVRMLRDAVARTAGDLAAEVMPDHAELQQVLNPRTALEEIDRVDLLGMLGPRGAPSLQKLAAAAHRQNLLCQLAQLIAQQTPNQTFQDVGPPVKGPARSVPVVSVHASSQLECCICQEAAVSGSQSVRIASCLHPMCSECAVAFCSQADGPVLLRCPICRHQVTSFHCTA